MSWKSFHGIFALIFVLLHVPCDAEVLSHCTCGRSNQNFVSRIVGGRETSRHEYPWVVGIVSEDGLINCGGSIISSRHVLSAGHCVFHDPSDPIGQRFIIVGAHDMNAIEPEMIYGISKAIMHPAWTAYDSWDNSSSFKLNY
uniref:CSON014320 protein n=1 Tax=Culicoides sonorensis TaxID=179676 RepID=A0A336KTY5_CULSO